MANGNSGGTPAVAGPVSQGMAGIPATAGPVSQGMAGTPATAGPVSTVGGAVATGQGTAPGGNAGGGAAMRGPEGDVAKGPQAAAQTKLGPDGEPEPVGNAAQRAAGAAVAATFNKNVANNLKASGAKAQMPEQNPQQPQAAPQQPVSAEQQKIQELERQLAELKAQQNQPQQNVPQGQVQPPQQGQPQPQPQPQQNNNAGLTPEQMAVILGQTAPQSQPQAQTNPADQGAAANQRAQQMQEQRNAQQGLSEDQEAQARQAQNQPNAPAPQGGQEAQAAQDAANKAYQDATRPGQTQSTPGPTPAEQSEQPQNAVGIQNFKVEGQGSVQPPANG